MSGLGSRRVAHTALVDAPIVLARLEAAVAGDDRGAVVAFSGIVRDHDRGRAVAALEYEAHPDAGEALAEAARWTAARHPAVTVAVEHRVGALAIGDIALGCAVAAAHRGEAFAACAALVDRVKESVPVWKLQTFADGATEWVDARG